MDDDLLAGDGVPVPHWRSSAAAEGAGTRGARLQRQSDGLGGQPALRAHVEEKLKLRWSPQQISRRLLGDFPDDPSMRVSHETIYTSLFVQTKAVLRTELTGQLRTRRVRRRPHRRVSAARTAGRIPDMTPIVSRPAQVLDRREPGHWEGDLLVGRYGRSHMVTLVERLSRYLPVLPVPDATSVTVTTAVSEALNQLPVVMRKSLTWDRGIEMTRHAEVTAATGVPVYFCDAYCPWQRGGNENSNVHRLKALPPRGQFSRAVDTTVVDNGWTDTAVDSRSITAWVNTKTIKSLHAGNNFKATCLHRGIVCQGLGVVAGAGTFAVVAAQAQT